MPFGHRAGACTFSEIGICIGNILPTIVGCCSFGGLYICVGYILPTIVGCCSVGVCEFVLDIFCQQLLSLLQLGGVCVPFGHKVGPVHVLIYVFGYT